MDTPKYFTPAEVAAHNTAEDLWVSFLGKVCNLTPLMNQFKGDFTLNRCGNKCLTYFPFNLSDFIPATSCPLVAYFNLLFPCFALHFVVQNITAEYFHNIFSVPVGDALLLPIMECAGKDISHWFDPETKDVSV